MAINLRKGGSFDLEKRLSRVRIGLAWDGNAMGGAAFDADVSVAVLKGADKKSFIADEWFIFYNNLRAPGDAVVHSGDNRTGQAEGDDETVTIDLNALPPETTEVAVVATIHEGLARRQDWSKLKAVATLYNDADGSVLASYPLGTDFAGKVSVQPVSLYRGEGGKWTFAALGAGYDVGLDAFVAQWSS
ncbi:TerD family protein [Muricoccus radiodurans]|uniref:TerD family protein n=1 Tax=Muricoccus radiodurans TaxID=2231721 RepID=UPI003CEBB0BB